MRLYASSYNTIYGCYFRNNECGIWLFGSQNNSIYHNNFMENINHLTLEGHDNSNILHDGYPSGGNYWSNYATVDICSGQDQNFFGSDGIGDMPYAFDQNNIDRYPLMGIVNTFEAGVYKEYLSIFLS
ncbi:MAG: NosD domain-containing protein [Candidatus Bathyarchaeia archaeon]|nr:NosD domain-containing protein [Candidatus Bathyarchaeia archaeon]